MRKIKPQQTTFDNTMAYIDGAWLKLKSAESNLDIDEEVVYQLAYEAMLKASLGLMLGCGYRPRSLPGHHKIIIQFAGKKLGKKFGGLIGKFDRMRRKRNKVIYEPLLFISKTEAVESIKTAKEYLRLIEKKIREQNSQKELF